MLRFKLLKIISTTGKLNGRKIRVENLEREESDELLLL